MQQQTKNKFPGLCILKKCGGGSQGLHLAQVFPPPPQFFIYFLKASCVCFSLFSTGECTCASSLKLCLFLYDSCVSLHNRYFMMFCVEGKDGKGLVSNAGA